MLSSSDCVGLYVKIIELLRFDIETPEYRGLSIKVKYFLVIILLTLFILMDSPKHIDTISKGKSISCFKGSQVEISKL